jgi:hypothetical protein
MEVMKKILIVIVASTVVNPDQGKKIAVYPKILELSIPASSGILLSYRSWNSMSNLERTILITGFTQGPAAEYAYDIKVINVISYINRYYKTTGKRWQTVDRIIEMYLKQFEKVEPDYNVA